MDNQQPKIRLLVTLANHEIPPRTETPGIGRLIHSQLTKMDYDQYDIAAVCIETNLGSLLEAPPYKYVRIPFNKSQLALFKIIGKHLRLILFGITDAHKIYRNTLIFLYALRNIKKFDVVIVHNYPLSAIWLKYFSRFANPKAKIIYYYHSSNLHWFLSTYPKLKSVDAIITIAGDTIENIPLCNIINNHSRQNAFHSETQKNKSIRLVCSSNIDPNKGTIHIVNAVKKLSESGYHIELDLYGISKDTSYFNTVMEAIKLTPCITYKGGVSHITLMSVLPTYDAIILLSQEMEGNSMSLIEAIVEARIPCIASTVGGNPLVLNNGRFGLLIQQYQNSDELFRVLLSCIENPQQLQTLKLNIEAEADNYFSPKRSAEKLSTFIKQIMHP